MRDAEGSFDIREAIRNAWMAAGEEESTRSKSLSIETAIEYADSHNEQNIPITVRNWLLVFDEFGAWYANLLMLLLFVARKKDKKLSNKYASLLSLMSNIVGQIVAIRRLVVSGLDVQAKQLLRNLVEQLDLAILLSHDDRVADEFVETVDGDQSNRFWHKYISKGKGRAKFHSKIKEFLGKEGYDEFKRHIDQEERILVMTVHLSIAASQMTLLAISFQNQKDFHLG